VKRRAALYFHIPFCQSKCLYCDFPTFAGKESLIPDYLHAVSTELSMVFGAEGWGFGRSIETIFFGGGTPSLLSADQVKFLLQKVGKLTEVLPDAEITLEANPGTVSREKLAKLRAVGVNRLSLGIQCAEDRSLKLLGRIHTVHEGEEAFYWAREAGFNNINLDLIFGLPGQDERDWKKTLNWAVGLNPDHLTCYGLQVEEGTPLKKMVDEGVLTLPTQEEVGAMYAFTMDYLPAHTYRQYEIASYARPRFECQHNLYYWKYRDYLGVGAGAFSTVEGCRWANTNCPDGYINRIKKGKSPIVQKEELTEEEKMVELIMLGLRLAEGPDADDFARRWKTSLESVLHQTATPLIRDGFLKFNNQTYTLTKPGKLVGNIVLRKLLEPIL